MEVYGLLGNPVGHSLSPAMHEAGFEALGIDARYVTFEPESVAEAVQGAAALGIGGLNVTIPFKEEALAVVEPDATAFRIGAVNTIDFSSDPPAGHNTDIAGVRRSFRHHDIDLAGEEAVLVGAGGAGRAVAFALSDGGATVRIANRTSERAESLAGELEAASAHDLAELPELIAGATILVNATSVGMETDESVVPKHALHNELIVMDAVYRPLETRLLADAAAVGAATIDGAWMLLYQGVEAFELWTGESAPVEVMNHTLRDHLAA